MGTFVPHTDQLGSSGTRGLALAERGKSGRGEGRAWAGGRSGVRAAGGEVGRGCRQWGGQAPGGPGSRGSAPPGAVAAPPGLGLRGWRGPRGGSPDLVFLALSDRAQCPAEDARQRVLTAVILSPLCLAPPPDWETRLLTVRGPPGSGPGLPRVASSGHAPPRARDAALQQGGSQGSGEPRRAGRGPPLQPLRLGAAELQAGLGAAALPRLLRPPRL